MAMRKQLQVDVYLSEDQRTVTVFVGGRSDAIVVGCLGIEPSTPTQPKRIYTNACFHRPMTAEEYIGWRPLGAISTILEEVPVP